jgi:hypothetical protein
VKPVAKQIEDEYADDEEEEIDIITPTLHCSNTPAGITLIYLLTSPEPIYPPP